MSFYGIIFGHGRPIFKYIFSAKDLYMISNRNFGFSLGLYNHSSIYAEKPLYLCRVKSAKLSNFG